MFFMATYLCPSCETRSESLERRGQIPETRPCPCGGVAEKSIGATKSKTVWGYAASQGGVAEKPCPGAMDTRALADGMPLKEWKSRRRRYRLDERRKQVRGMVG